MENQYEEKIKDLEMRVSELDKNYNFNLEITKEKCKTAYFIVASILTVVVGLVVYLSHLPNLL